MHSARFAFDFMNKEQLKQRYSRFRSWQQAAQHYANRHAARGFLPASLSQHLEPSYIKERALDKSSVTDYAFLWILIAVVVLVTVIPLSSYYISRYKSKKASE